MKDSLSKRTRIRCKVKSTFSETRLVPALNDLLIANPSPGAVSRFRLGWLSRRNDEDVPSSLIKDAKTRFAGISYDVEHSLNVWSSGMWVSTSTGSTAAMAASGGQSMDLASSDLQFMIREHMIENSDEIINRDVDNGFIENNGKFTRELSLNIIGIYLRCLRSKFLTLTRPRKNAPSLEFSAGTYIYRRFALES